MDFEAVTGNLFIGSFLYVIFSGQIAGGMPPIYVGRDHKTKHPNYKSRMLSFIIPSHALIFVSFALLLIAPDTGFPIVFMVLASIFPIRAALKTRQFVKSESGYPYPFVFYFFGYSETVRNFLDRYPMVLFDIWSVGMSLIFTSLFWYL